LKRCDLLTLAVGTAIAWSLAARAQQKVMPVIDFISGRASGEIEVAMIPFRRALAEGGYIEGQSLTIEYRYAEGHYERYPAFSADLVGRNVNLIVTFGGSSAARAAKKATSTIPIVFYTGGDPVADGLVASLARPGGNLTGVSVQFNELAPKRLEFLCELVPQAQVIALLVNPTLPADIGLAGVQEAARAKGVRPLS